MVENELEVPIDSVVLLGRLSIPDNAKGIVLFAHGSGSSRQSPRNNYVAGVLQKSGFATFLFDLLTREEEAIDMYTRRYRFDIDLLSDRLVLVTDWISKNYNYLQIGYFGASTGAAAAIISSVKSPGIRAIVSRGGRPDLAIDYLAELKSPTLLIVGGYDIPVIKLNQTALERIAVEKKLEIVPGATHLFEEQGALEQVARLAADWFLKYL